MFVSPVAGNYYISMVFPFSYFSFKYLFYKARARKNINIFGWKRGRGGRGLETFFIGGGRGKILSGVFSISFLSGWKRRGRGGRTLLSSEGKRKK